MLALIVRGSTPSTGLSASTRADRAFFDPERVVDILADMQIAPFPATAATPSIAARTAFIADYYDLGARAVAEPDPMLAYDLSDRFVELAEARAFGTQ